MPLPLAPPSLFVWRPNLLAPPPPGQLPVCVAAQPVCGAGPLWPAAADGPRLPHRTARAQAGPHLLARAHHDVLRGWVQGVGGGLASSCATWQGWGGQAVVYFVFVFLLLRLGCEGGPEREGRRGGRE